MTMMLVRRRERAYARDDHSCVDRQLLEVVEDEQHTPEARELAPDNRRKLVFGDRRKVDAEHLGNREHRLARVFAAPSETMNRSSHVLEVRFANSSARRRISNPREDRRW